MARTVREFSLQSRTPRFKLRVRGKPYWRALEPGLHLGYRRSSSGGAWIGRRRTEQGGYRETRIGIADDLQEPDGELILSFAQAQAACREWRQDERRLEQGKPVRGRGPYSVKNACVDYSEDYRRRGGKAMHTIHSAFDTHVLPDLGAVPLAKLTTNRLRDWHLSLAEQGRRVRTKKGREQQFLAVDLGNPDAVRRRRATVNRILTYLRRR